MIMVNKNFSLSLLLSLYHQLVCQASEYSVRLGTLSVANEPVCRQIMQICLYLSSITRTFMTDFE